MVNQLPQGWKEVKLKDICVLINGRAFKQHELLDSGKYKVLRVGNFFSNNKWYYSDLELDNDKYCDQGDLLFAWSASFGPKIWNDKKTIYHYHIWKVKVNEFVEKKFLYYLLLADSQKIKKSGHGVAMIHITKMDMENRLYTIPTDKDEQEYIVKTLDAVAEMIKLRKETIQLTKDLIPAIFQEMFGDPITNPKGWEITTLGNPDVCTLQYGYTATAQDSGDTRYIRITDIGKDGYIDNGNKAWLNYDNKMEDYKLYPKDILVARTGASYGKTLLYNNDTDAIFASFLIRIIFNKKKIIPEFYWAYSLTDSYWQQANRLVSGVAQPQFNGSALKQILLMLPPLSLQDEFADKVDQINQNLEVQQKDLERLQELFDQLLQKAFTGELTRGETYGKH